MDQNYSEDVISGTELKLVRWLTAIMGTHGLVVVVPSSSTWVMMGPRLRTALTATRRSHTHTDTNMKAWCLEVPDVLGEGVRSYELRVALSNPP